MRYGRPLPTSDKLPKLTWPSIARLLRLALPYRWFLATAAILTLTPSGRNLAPPPVAKSALDQVLKTHSIHSLDLMAELAGMRLRERWSGWKREPFTSASRKHVSVWERSS